MWGLVCAAVSIGSSWCAFFVISKFIGRWYIYGTFWMWMILLWLCILILNVCLNIEKTVIPMNIYVKKRWRVEDQGRTCYDTTISNWESIFDDWHFFRKYWLKNNTYYCMFLLIVYAQEKLPYCASYWCSNFLQHFTVSIVHLEST